MRFFFLATLLVFSCSSKKDILLVQDFKLINEYDFSYKNIKIKSDDILRIKISSKSTNLESLYNSNQNLQSSSNQLGYKIEGYQVDSNGFVSLPVLDPISVRDLTLVEASQKIQKILEDEDVIKNASVDIKILNAYFTILGEVNAPGRYSFLENNMDIFQALGIAGDLTINGLRNDIRVISDHNGKIVVNSLDLTSANLLQSESFQIFPGDVIIVNANNARVKNAGIIGNFGNLLSVLSFILTSVIVISNN